MLEDILDMGAVPITSTKITRIIMRKKLKKINKKESKRLGSSNVVRTSHFRNRQTFGAANKGRSLSQEEINEWMIKRK